MPDLIESVLLAIVAAMGAVAIPMVRRHHPRWVLYPVCLVLLWFSSAMGLALFRMGDTSTAIVFGLLVLWCFRNNLKMLVRTQKGVDAELDKRHQEYERFREEEERSAR